MKIYTLLTAIIWGFTLSIFSQNAPFKTEWVTNDGEIEIIAGGSAPIIYPYNYDIKWYKKSDPGTILNSAVGVPWSMTINNLPVGDTIVVEITGIFPHFYAGDAVNTVNNTKLVAVSQWGDVQWQHMNSSFFYCSNLHITATDAPDLSVATQMNSTFYGAVVMNEDISSWDVSNITSMVDLFNFCISFNQPLNSWDVSNVQSMFGMFTFATNFNQPLNTWDVANVVDMGNMFAACDNFNQPLNNWDVSNVINMYQMFSGALSFNEDISSWDVFNVMTMENMFFLAESFNYDITSWNVSNVQNMNSMFGAATVFNQNLGGWNISNVQNNSNMFMYSGMSYCNFDSTLIGWSQQAVKPNLELVLNGNQPFYSSYGSAAKNVLTSAPNNWKINSSMYNVPNVSLSVPNNVCYGGVVSLSNTGPSLSPGNYYEWFKGACDDTLLGTSTSNSFETPADFYGAKNYFVRVFDGTGCPTSCVSSLVTITKPANVANHNDSKVCLVKGNQFVDFVVADRALLSINPQGVNLGDVTVTSYVEGAPILVQDCTNPLPQHSKHALQRHYLVKPSSSATGSFRVRAYMLDGEFTSLVNSASTNTNPDDDLTLLPELQLTKFQGTTEDGLFSNNCGNGTFSLHTQNTNGNVSSLITGFNSLGRFVEYSVPSFSELWFHGSKSNAPLPIELTRFDANCESNRVHLTWSTASELNNSLFFIEKSIDGKTWDYVTSINGQGNSNIKQDYDYWDSPSEKNIYYKISQQDYDGSVVSYIPITANCGNLQTEHWTLYSYPNPVENEGYVRINSPETYKTTVRISDLVGKVIFENQITVLKGEHDYSFQINGAEAIYILSLQDHNKINRTVKLLHSK